MSRVKSMQYDDQDQVHWDGGQEVRKAQSVKDRSKKSKSKSIRSGIDEYWDKKQWRQGSDNLLDNLDDASDLGQFDDETLH